MGTPRIRRTAYYGVKAVRLLRQSEVTRTSDPIDLFELHEFLRDLTNKRL